MLALIDSYPAKSAKDLFNKIFPKGMYEFLFIPNGPIQVIDGTLYIGIDFIAFIDTDYIEELEELIKLHSIKYLLFHTECITNFKTYFLDLIREAFDLP